MMSGDPVKRKNLASLPPEVVRPPEAAFLLSVSLSLLKKVAVTGKWAATCAV